MIGNTIFTIFFTTNFKWQVVIVGLKSYSVLNQFELIITNHLWFVVKVL